MERPSTSKQGEKRSMLINVQKPKVDIKGKESLGVYAQAQETKAKRGIAYHPTSARATKDKGNKGLIETKDVISPEHHKMSISQFEGYINSLDPSELKDEKNVNEATNKLTEIFQGTSSVKQVIEAEKMRCAKDFKIRKGSANKERSKDVNVFLRQKNYSRMMNEKNKNLWSDTLSDKTGEKYLKKIQSEPVIIGEADPDNIRDEFIRSQDVKNMIHQKTPMALRPQTAKENMFHSRKSPISSQTIIKVSEQYTMLPKDIWKQNSMSKLTSPNHFNKEKMHSNSEIFNKNNGRNFIKRIESRAVSATHGLKTNYRGSSLALDVKHKYKMLILNWGKELEKHDKILEKFHIFSPLKYDIDVTFHKLFSTRSKELIKQKLKFKKKNNLMKAGFLENEIDLMFASDTGLANKYGFENDELLMGTKYEEQENKHGTISREVTEDDKLMNEEGKATSNLETKLESIDPSEARPNIVSVGNTETINIETPHIPMETESVMQNKNQGIKEEDTEIKTENVQVVTIDPQTPHKQVMSEEEKVNFEGEPVYDSPFKKSPSKPKTENDAFALFGSHALDEEFPDQDIQMKIRDKDVVFIYEIDDIIKQLIGSTKNKVLEEETEILDILNRFSKLFRHYIRYRVVDIGDLVGGLFLDGFWKTLLITIDNILESIDNRCKRRVIRMQKEYSKIIDQLYKRLAEKDEEMKRMDKSELIQELENKLKMIKEEKIMYQNLAQDKENFIEQLTNDETRFKELNEAISLYEKVTDLMETAEEEKKQDVKTIENLYKMFDTARNLRKSVCVQTQTDFTTVSTTKIKDIELPAINDCELIKVYSHPFSRAMRFLNQETLEFTKRLTFEPLKLRDIFIINETVIDKIGNELIGYSQRREEELQQLLKK